MSTPAGPVAYCTLSLDVEDGGAAYVLANGCIMDPDGSLQSLAGSYSFSVSVPLAAEMTADSVQTAIAQAIATSYGGTAPDVVLLPSF